jgi:hypothetical protein
MNVTPDALFGQNGDGIDRLVGWVRAPIRKGQDDYGLYCEP